MSGDLKLNRKHAFEVDARKLSEEAQFDGIFARETPLQASCCNSINFFARARS